MKHVETVRKEVQFVCLAEHKKAEECIGDAQTKWRKLGFKSWWSQAVRTGNGGVSGGTSIHGHRCYVASRLDWARVDGVTHLPK